MNEAVALFFYAILSGIFLRHLSKLAGKTEMHWVLCRNVIYCK